MNPDQSDILLEQLSWYTERVIAWAVSEGIINPKDRTEALEQLAMIDDEKYASFSRPPHDIMGSYAIDRPLVEGGLLKTRLTTNPDQTVRFERYPTHDGIRALLGSEHHFSADESNESNH